MISTKSALHPYPTDMEKDNLSTQARFEPKKMLPEKVGKLQQKEFATKQSKLFFTKIMIKIGLPHIYRGKNYLINYIFPSV